MCCDIIMRLVIEMIVKNVENVIIRTLQSCVGIVDKVYISDTGSTDNTINLIKKFFEGTNKLRLIENPFIDFSINRNKVLDLIEKEENSDCMILALDANDEIVNGLKLVEYLAENRESDAYFISHEWLDQGKRLRYKTIRIFKNNPNIRYDGSSVHEFITGINGFAMKLNQTVIPDFYVYQNRDIDLSYFNEHTTKPRLERDYELLKKSYMEDPKNMRTIYYLAQTCYAMNKFVEAKRYFAERFFDEILDEEIFQSYLKYAKCCYFLKEPFTEIEKYLWKAHQYSTKMQAHWEKINVLNIEPLMIIASEYFSMGKYQLAHELTIQACNAPVPDTVLQCDITIYNYKRWVTLAKTSEKMNDPLMGFDACNIALSSDDAKEIYQYYKKIKLQHHEKELINQIETLNILRKQFEITLDAKYHKISDKPLFVIYGGSLEKVVKIAENISVNGFKVVVFSDNKERVTNNNVEYLRLTDYEGFVQTHHIDTLVVFGIVSAIKYGYNIKEVYLWLNDVNSIDKPFMFDKSMKGIIMQCEDADTEYFKKKYLPKELYYLVKVINNGIDLKSFIENLLLV